MQTPTIADAARQIAARRLSPVELTQHLLDRIAAEDAALNSFILVTPERALSDARAAEARVMAGEARGPLDGIPIAHKDIYGTAGIPTTGHSKLLQGWVPDTDATTVRKLAEAGTAMLGKLATHEFALGGPSFDLPWPPARNPWNTDHFTAGSSSGTGAAVAAGLILGGTGSDTGGSIRGPAALCGIAGIKPTYGLCSRAGILPLSYSLDHAGPMAWTAEDCAMLLQVMAGHDPQDPASADRPASDFCADLQGGVKGLRIGVARSWHETDRPVSPAVQAGINGALDIWRAQGAEVREVALPSLYDYQAALFVILVAEAFSLHEPWMQERFGDHGELLRDRMAFGGLLAATDYVQAPGAVRCHDGGGAKPRSDRHRRRARGSAAHRRRAEMGHPGPARLHRAVQHHGLARPMCLLRLRRGRPAGQREDLGQALRRHDPVPRRPRL